MLVDGFLRFEILMELDSKQLQEVGSLVGKSAVYFNVLCISLFQERVDERGLARCLLAV